MRLVTALLPLVGISTNVRFHEGRAARPGTVPAPGGPRASARPDETPCGQCGRPFVEAWDVDDPALCAQCALERFCFDREARWQRPASAALARG